MKYWENEKLWDFMMYAVAAGLIVMAMRIDGSREIYGMINLMIGAVIRDIGSGKGA